MIIPKEAHYRLGAIQRAHAMRRPQLLKMHEDPNLQGAYGFEFTGGCLGPGFRV